MKKDVQAFIAHYEPLRDIFSHVELMIINHNFIAGLMTFLEKSKDGKLTVDEIIKAHNLSVLYQLEVMELTSNNSDGLN